MILKEQTIIIIMETFLCPDGCCKWSRVPYTHPKNWTDDWVETTQKIKKSGGFIYDGTDQKNIKILLIQSRGQLWGSPKGSMNDGETVLECAKREVKEESGIEIVDDNILGSIIVKNKAMYYIVNMQEMEVFPQTNVEDNDANGIGWFNVNCLINLIKYSKIKVNQHLRILVKKILDIELPNNNLF